MFLQWLIQCLCYVFIQSLSVVTVVVDDMHGFQMGTSVVLPKPQMKNLCMSYGKKHLLLGTLFSLGVGALYYVASIAPLLRQYKEFHEWLFFTIFPTVRGLLVLYVMFSILEHCLYFSFHSNKLPWQLIIVGTN